jgi:hypothetical protein
MGMAGRERYEIRVQGHLSEHLLSIIEGADLRNEPNGEAVITLSVPDQSSLHGVLTRLHGLGIPLVALHRIRTTEEKEGR